MPYLFCNDLLSPDWIY